MKVACKQSPRGVALIVVLIAIFVLSLLVGVFAYSMKVEMRLAQHANNEDAIIWLGRSGVERASWIVAQTLLIRNENYDALNQKWAGGDGTMASSNSPLANISLENYSVGAGKITLTITDMERKFNINVANQEVLRQALILMGVDASETDLIADSILDWIDPNDDVRINGTESDYYQSKRYPYFAKNAPIDDITELLFVRGVTRDIFWGPHSTNHVPSFLEEPDPYAWADQQVQYTSCLVDLFTPISAGRLNVNTASELTLQLIPGIDAAYAGEIVKRRAGPDGDEGTFDDTPAGSPENGRVEDLLMAAGMANQEAAAAARYLDKRSRSFHVRIDAEIGGTKRTFYAILGRNNQRDVQVLSFYWE